MAIANRKQSFLSFLIPKSKKGVLFTILSIILVSILILITISATTQKTQQNFQTIEDRVKSMNSFMQNLDEDLERGLYIASYRSLFAIEDEIIASENHIDLNIFPELCIHGTLNNVEKTLMQDSSFNDWVGKMQFHANDIGIKLQITTETPQIYHINPWIIEIQLPVSITANDSTNIASWTQQKTITAKINISGFEDPLYALNTAGRVSNSIYKTPYKDFVSGNDTTNLLSHTLNSYYIASTTAPSFLMRLEGNFNPSEFGIESLVNLEKLESQGLPPKAKSAVDYIYFSENSPTSHMIQGMPVWFRLDDNHLSIYEVEGLVI